MTGWDIAMSGRTWVNHLDGYMMAGLQIVRDKHDPEPPFPKEVAQLISTGKSDGFQRCGIHHCVNVPSALGARLIQRFKMCTALDAVQLRASVQRRVFRPSGFVEILA